MRVIFMGTPDFALPSLRALLDRGEEIVGVFCQPDKPKGRGHKLQPPPVKELALERRLPVFQPATLKTAEAKALVRSLSPDVIIVAAYGKLLPREVLDTPPLGCINVHGSLLPKYRGAAPIQWAVLGGEKVSGVCTMRMALEMDAGDILLSRETPIGPEETAGELFDRLSLLGAEVLGETLDRLPELTPVPQNPEQVTFAPMLSKELSLVDWSDSAQHIHDKIRGLNPWPLVSAELDGSRVKLLASRVLEGLPSGTQHAPGAAVCEGGELYAVCGQGVLRITELQSQQGKRMSGREYLLGHPLKEGSRFA